DRDVAVLANTFDERDPAVKAAIAQLVGQARQLGISCSICGQAPSRYPDLVEWLVQLGIHTLSVEPEAVVTTHHAIAQAERHLLPNQGSSDSSGVE
ncbi:MAG TPA: putative PEP-binding protein, partial [Coleofasciculaceae cyanobacterium]